MTRQTSVLCLVLVLLVAAVLPAPAPAAPRLETVLGADMDFLFLVEDIGAMRAEWSTSALGGLWHDPAFGSMADSARTALSKALGENGEAEMGEILDLLQGQVALSMNLEPGEMGGKPSVSWTFMAGFADEAGFSSLSAAATRIRDEGTLEESTETVDGVTVRTRLSETGDEESWAYVDGIGIVGHPADAVKTIITGLKGKAPGPRLAAAPGYVSMQKQAPRADVAFLIHFAGLSRLLTRIMEQGMEENPNASMMGLTGEGVSQALALDAIDALYMTWDEEETESVLHSGLLFHGDEGIVGLLSYLPGPCLRPEFIPQNALMASSSRMSFPAMYAGLMKMLEALNPGIAMMAQAQLQQLTMSYGLDLEKDLLAGLGEDSFWAYLPAEGDAPMPDQVFGIAIKNSDQITNVLAAVKATMGAVEEPEPVGRVGDTAILSLAAPEAEGELYYAVTDTYLFVCRGSSESLVTILEGMRKPGPSIWTRKDLKPYFDRLPKNPSGLTYYDLGSLFRTTMAAMEKREDLDQAGVPDMSVVSRHFGALVGGEYKTDEGMLGIAYLRHLKP
jgi:hypothetical protein